MTYSFKKFDLVNANNCYSAENKAQDSYLQKIAFDNFYPLNNFAVSPTLSANKYYNFDYSKMGNYTLENKEPRRMSMNVNFAPTVNFYNPFDCFVDTTTVPIKSKREHLDDMTNRISLEKVTINLNI
jgi:hypothetical protein